MKNYFFGRFILILYAAFVLSASFFLSRAFGDTVTLNSGKQIKGLVVDEYVDRIVVSTFSGEKTVLRSELKDIMYEEEEARLLKLAKKAMSQNKYDTAIYYYRQVLKINPNSKQAKDGESVAVRKNLGKNAEIAKEEIELMVSLEHISEKAQDEKTLNDKNVRELLGLTLRMNNENKTCYIDRINPNSASSGYDLRRNDVVSAVWNESVKYMPYEAVLKKLAGPEFSMVKFSVERMVNLQNPKRLRWDVGLNEEGYFVKDVYGANAYEKKTISPGDKILEVSSKQTRYMPKRELIALLSSDEKSIDIVVEKDFYITRSKRR